MAARVVSSDVSLNTNLANFRQQKHSVRNLGDGMYSIVEATITRRAFNKAHSDVSDLNYENPPVDDIARRVAAKLAATKVFKHRNAAAITREARIIAALAQHRNTNIVNFYPRSKWTEAGATLNNEYWYDLEMLSGGSLVQLDQTLRATYDQPSIQLPVAFCWHMAEQLFSALLLVHFDGAGRSRYCHADIKKSNILIRPSRNNDNSYPDVVLTDFGRTVELPANEQDDDIIHKFWERQVKECQTLGAIITSFNPQRDRALHDLISDIGRLDLTAPDNNGNQPTRNIHLEAAVNNIINAARTHLNANAFEPLQERVLQRIDRRCLSDSALRNFVRGLINTDYPTATRAGRSGTGRRSARQTRESPDVLRRPMSDRPGVQTRAQRAAAAPQPVVGRARRARR
ncbi:hypothetical protein CKM354_001022000 [Cercospora kikuchii]|uniref:Protein kinase domain-containing protein n=1 Tax=Cercospora kikuchii TaxID=84275 RepID=A0A9P3CUW5_9PEZI|nr:uncharacterized protein CKM354_001022000 [Cercospora kikuchii]GIZ47120.1 hypothetical protein CKM354_001022000 [Cercospora kikuchii]